MKKLLFAFAAMAVLLTSCKDDEVEAKDAPLSEYVVGDWNFTGLIISGNIQTPVFSGPIAGEATDVSGTWTFAADGTLTGQMKYDISISIGGFPFDSEEVDETVTGSYVVKNESTLTITMDGESADYNVEGRTNTSFDVTNTEAVSEMGASGSITTRVKLAK